LKKYLNSQVSKNFIIYGATNAMASGLPLLLLPFLTNYLQPQDMAMIAMFQLFYNFLQPFIGVNGTSLTNVVFYSKTDDQFNRHRSAVIWLILITGLLVLLVVLPFNSIIFSYTGLSLKWLSVMVVFICFEQVNEFLLTYWRLLNKAWFFAIWRLLRVVFELSLSIGIVMYFNSSWTGRVEGIVISGAIVGLASIVIILKQNKGALFMHKIEMQEIIKFGIPFIPHVLGGIIINYSDLLFIRNMISEEATGLYSVGYQVGLIIGLVQNSFNQAWVPWFYAKLNNLTTEWNTRLVKMTYMYFAVLLLLAGGLYGIAPFLFSLFIDDRYIVAQDFVGWIAFGFALNGMYKMVVNYLIYLKLSKLIARVTFFVAILNVVFNYLLIKENGAIGAAQSTALSFFLQFVIIWYFSARFYPMNWKLTK
tara:strand:- start:20120 stop:21382 length:1263 start_codon:yes stop_codon:yes gene_type:complete